MEERIGWWEQCESQIRGEEKWQNCWWCRDQQKACGMAQDLAEKLEHTGPAEKKGVVSVPQRKQLESTVEPPLPKGKGTEPSVQITKSSGRESQGERELHLGKREGEIKAGEWRGEGWTPQ